MHAYNVALWCIIEHWAQRPLDALRPLKIILRPQLWEPLLYIIGSDHHRIKPWPSRPRLYLLSSRVEGKHVKPCYPDEPSVLLGKTQAVWLPRHVAWNSTLVSQSSKIIQVLYFIALIFLNLLFYFSRIYSYIIVSFLFIRQSVYTTGWVLIFLGIGKSMVI